MEKLTSNYYYNNKLLVHVAIVLVFSSCVFSSGDHFTAQRLNLQGGFGPESIVFDREGRGPYTAIADGRILKYSGRYNVGFVTFGYTISNRPARFCDGKNDTNLANICGRGLGLGFDYKSGKLYVADAIRGLVVFPRTGGVAKQLLNSAEGLPFKFFNSLDVDQNTGILYLIDLSSNYNISQFSTIVSTRDMSGRLLKYDPKTKQVTVLLRNLGAPAGVAISKDGSYLVFTEYIKKRIQKYWLKGPKANNAEVIINVTGNPDNIRRNEAGEFWVAAQENLELVGLRINGNGNLLERLDFSSLFNITVLSEVFEYKGYLFLGSVFNSYIGVYK